MTTSMLIMKNKIKYLEVYNPTDRYTAVWMATCSSSVYEVSLRDFSKLQKKLSRTERGIMSAVQGLQINWL